MPELEETGEGQIEGSKESGDLREDSRLRDEDTPESYEERLHRLYPREDQKAYITALMRVSQVAEYARCYCNESEEVKKMYTKDEEGTLYMSEEYANNLKSVCNIAWYYLEEKTDELVEEKRNERVEIPLELDMAINGLNIIPEPSQELIDRVNQEITAESLWLRIPDASESFKCISLLCSGHINPNELLGDLITIACARYEMGVYIDPTDLGEVYCRVLRKEV